MSINRVVSLAAAIVITGTQWTALSRPLTHTQSERAVGAGISVAYNASGALPVIVVMPRSGASACDRRGR